MNSHLLRKAFRQQYRKYAMRISVGVHVLFLIIFTVFFLKSQVTDMEDEIQVDIYELPKQPVAKKEVIPIPKKTPKPKQEVPTPRKQITLQKNVGQPKPAVDIAKIPGAAPAEVALQSEAVNKRSDADIPPALDAPDLSTDVKLTASVESILSPIPSDTSDTPGKSYGRREGTGVRKPGKGIGTGLGKHGKGTGTGLGKHGKGTGTADGVGKIGDGIGGSSSPFGNTIKNLAEDIIEKSGGAPIDVVLVVDTSGSMHDNIKAVLQHLGQMIDVYKASDIDYELGLTLFTTFSNRTIKIRTRGNKFRTGRNNIKVYPLTTNIDDIKQPLYAIEAGFDENILDAIDQTVREMRFRKNTVKHLILVSDEPKLETQQGLTADHVIKHCRKNQIHVNVLGVNNQDHKRLATYTGGIWHAIPQDTIAKKTPIINPYTARRISKIIFKDAVSMPVDIILFIDGSKSMIDKMPYLKQQIDFWLRDWDIALIDYRVGVVRFRASGGINMVTVFKPPQTQAQLHKILKLPCQNDENLLHAVVDGTRRLKIRADAKTHFILITDEPRTPKSPISGTIQFLKEIPVVVSVIGTTDTFQQQVAQQTGGIWAAMPNGHKMNEPYH